MTGRFIAVVGPSGVGKDTVMTALAKADPRLRLVRRVITRPSSLGGEDFDGVTDPVFDQMMEEDAFALCWRAHGLRYGIPMRVKEQLAEGCDVLANLSRKRLPDAQAQFSNFHVLLLSAQHDVLRTRLEARGRETPSEIGRRLTRADIDIPDGVAFTEIDNSGPLAQTISSVLGTLYPTEARS